MTIDQIKNIRTEAVAEERAKVYQWLLRMHDEAKSGHNYFEYAAIVLKQEWEKTDFDRMLDRMGNYPSYHDLNRGSK